MYSIVETAKANNLNVFQYLYTVLLYMPDYKNEPAGIEKLLPWSNFIKERCGLLAKPCCSTLGWQGTCLLNGKLL